MFFKKLAFYIFMGISFSLFSSCTTSDVDDQLDELEEEVAGLGGEDDFFGDDSEEDFAGIDELDEEEAGEFAEMAEGEFLDGFEDEEGSLDEDILAGFEDDEDFGDDFDDEFDEDELDLDDDELAELDEDEDMSDDDLESLLADGDEELDSLEEEFFGEDGDDLIAEQVDEPIQDDRMETYDDEVIAVNEPLQEEYFESSVQPVIEPAAAMAGLIPVKKIKTQAYFRNGRLINSVYIARPGDTVSSISMKIFNMDKSGQIVADNPWLSDGIKVGEKLYYSSPNRPSDNTAILTYYDDVRIPAQNYYSRAGENIRSVSANLMGFNDAWKEVWAFNPAIQSKGAIPAGLSIRYWGNSAAPVSAPTYAQNNYQPAQKAVTYAPPDDEPPMADGEEGFGEEDFEDDFEEAPEVDPLPAETPVDVSELQPAQTPSTPLQMVTKSDDSTMMMGLIALVILIGIFLLAIQVKKKRSLAPPPIEYTQV